MPPLMPSHRTTPSSGVVSGLVMSMLTSLMFSHTAAEEQTSRAMSGPSAPLEMPVKSSKRMSVMLTLDQRSVERPEGLRSSHRDDTDRLGN